MFIPYVIFFTCNHIQHSCFGECLFTCSVQHMQLWPCSRSRAGAAPSLKLKCQLLEEEAQLAQHAEGIQVSGGSQPTQTTEELHRLTQQRSRKVGGAARATADGRTHLKGAGTGASAMLAKLGSMCALC